MTTAATSPALSIRAIQPGGSSVREGLARHCAAKSTRKTAPNNVCAAACPVLAELCDELLESTKIVRPATVAMTTTREMRNANALRLPWSEESRVTTAMIGTGLRAMARAGTIRLTINWFMDDELPRLAA